MGGRLRDFYFGYDIPSESEQEEAGVRDRFVRSINIYGVLTAARDTTLNTPCFLL